MVTETPEFEFDVAVIGGGPAGLSAAIVLGRACRRVILFDHGHYRNYAARAVHGYLGLDGIEPEQLRHRGRGEAAKYGMKIHSCEVTAARCISGEVDNPTMFAIDANNSSYRARALLLATGVKDHLPHIPGLSDLYGKAVFHCPYCDGWEYRDKKLVALNKAQSVASLALTLRGWSPNVTACSNGEVIATKDRRRLEQNGIHIREERISAVRPSAGASEVVFKDKAALPFDALFFGADQTHAGKLPTIMGCSTGDDGLVQTNDKQGSGQNGLFVAGDLHSDVQMAIVAAAEGAIAATAINKMLLAQDAAAGRRAAAAVS